MGGVLRGCAVLGMGRPRRGRYSCMRYPSPRFGA